MSTSLARCITRTVATLLGIAVGTCALAPALAKKSDASRKPGGAELAFRWDPAEGGPKTVAQTLEVLGASQKTPERYRVTYLKVEHFPELAGFCSILRQRTRVDKDEYQITFKFRGDSPLPPRTAAGEWTCPVGQTGESKDEVDVTVLADTEVRKYSRSCTVEADAAPPLPASFGATLERHESTMLRAKADGNVVEEWHLPDGSVTVEVSAKGPGDAQQVASFRKLVVDRLAAAGAKPSAGNKSESSAYCPK